MKIETEQQIHGLAEAIYQTGYNDGQNAIIEQRAEISSMRYNKGLDDAWECLKTIDSMPTIEVNHIFNDLGIHNILAKFSASEAIAKIEEYKEHQLNNNIDRGLIKDKLKDLVEFYGKDRITEVLEQMEEAE